MPVSQCAMDDPAAIDTLSASCRDFVDSSERAREEWRLEASFAAFEDRY